MTDLTHPSSERIVQHEGRTYRVRTHHVEEPESSRTPTIVVMSSTDTADPHEVQYQAYGLVSDGWGGQRWAVLGTPESDAAQCLTIALANPWSSSSPDVLTKALLDAAVAS